MKDWDTSRVTDCSVLFWEQVESDWVLLPGADVFNVDLSGWSTSSCTTMRSMFNSATKFNQPIGHWSTSRVTDMSRMFESAESFDQDISAWPTTRVTDLSHAFRYASLFNNGGAQQLPWDVSRVQRFQFMFHDADRFTADISLWNVSGANDASAQAPAVAFGYMFQGAARFNGDLSQWNIQGARSLRSMFQSATAFNQDLSAWNVERVTDFYAMLQMATSLNQTLCWRLPREDDDTVIMDHMLDGTQVGTRLDPSCWKAQVPTPQSPNKQQQDQAATKAANLIVFLLLVLVSGVAIGCYMVVRGRQRKRRIIFRSNNKVEEIEVLFQVEEDDEQEGHSPKSVFEEAREHSEHYYDLDFQGNNQQQQQEEEHDEGVVSFVPESLPAAPVFVPSREGDRQMMSLEQHAVSATLAVLPPEIDDNDKEGSYTGFV